MAGRHHTNNKIFWDATLKHTHSYLMCNLNIEQEALYQIRCTPAPKAQ